MISMAQFNPMPPIVDSTWFKNAYHWWSWSFWSIHRDRSGWLVVATSLIFRCQSSAASYPLGKSWQSLPCPSFASFVPGNQGHSLFLNENLESNQTKEIPPKQSIGHVSSRHVTTVTATLLWWPRILHRFRPNAVAPVSRFQEFSNYNTMCLRCFECPDKRSIDQSIDRTVRQAG